MLLWLGDVVFVPDTSGTSGSDSSDLFLSPTLKPNPARILSRPKLLDRFPNILPREEIPPLRIEEISLPSIRDFTAKPATGIATREPITPSADGRAEEVSLFSLSSSSFPGKPDFSFETPSIHLLNFSRSSLRLSLSACTDLVEGSGSYLSSLGF